MYNVKSFTFAVVLPQLFFKFWSQGWGWGVGGSKSATAVCISNKGFLFSIIHNIS